MGAVEAAAERKYHDKEDFVTGHNGTTPYEIFLMCCVIPIGLQLYYKLYNYHAHAFFLQQQQSMGASNNKGTMLKKWMSSVIIIEFCTLILPMLLVQTSLLSYMVGPTILLVGMLSLSYMIPTVNNKPTQYYHTESFGPSASTKSSSTAVYRPAYLSIHRASVYILTTIAILAVDFPLFPRRFCKTEVSGYGFMDVGASSFIIIAGWTSALSSSSAHDESSQHDAKGSSKMLHAKRSSNNNTMRAIKKCLPLFLIGFIRLVTNKGLEYQEHVSEYGVHWNFFFTLCCVEGFMVLWKGVKRQFILLGSIITDNSNILGLYCLDGMLALLMIVPYQMFLSYYGGQEFIEDGERRCNYDEGKADNMSYAEQFLPSILCNAYSANREGILGVVGYVSLRLISEDVARICLLVPIQRQQTLSLDEQHKNNNNKYQPMMRQHTQLRLFIMSIVLWMSHLYLTIGLRIPTSRRSTNASFILWSLAHNVSLLCMIHYVMMMNAPKTTTEETGDGSKQQQQHLHRPYILLEAINRYGLAVFLSSNVLTGLVNLTVDTLHSSDGKAMLVMMIYLGLVCGFALLLDGLFDKTKTKG